MKIFLIGMPGSGKSTIGKQLAIHLDLPFIDLDKEIERETGQKIRFIFQEKGEAYFRELERDTLHKLIHEHLSFVMATGGGAPCFYDNLRQMKEVGITVFLNVSPAAIARRMSKKGVKKRPLLSGMDQDNLEKEFAAKFQHRMPFYQQARYEIKEGHIDASYIASLIKSKSTKS